MASVRGFGQWLVEQKRAHRGEVSVGFVLIGVVFRPFQVNELGVGQRS